MTPCPSICSRSPPENKREGKLKQHVSYSRRQTTIRTPVPLYGAIANQGTRGARWETVTPASPAARKTKTCIEVLRGTERPHKIGQPVQDARHLFQTCHGNKKKHTPMRSLISSLKRKPHSTLRAAYKQQYLGVERRGKAARDPMKTAAGHGHKNNGTGTHLTSKKPPARGCSLLL